MPVIETPSRMEPCLLSPPSDRVNDLVADLVRASEALRLALPKKSAENLADLVRFMNCYYSNLIEGHNTTPREIERAMTDEAAQGGEHRNLLIEARAHILVQRTIDRLYADGTMMDPTSVAFIEWLHESFYQNATEEMLTVESKDGRKIRITPGVMRQTAAEEVEVGAHLPPPSDRVAVFMDYFSDRYRMDRLGSSARIVAIPAAHHRLNFIHPFIDGNGRVSRLMSHAMALHAGIGAHGLWSISRGLARGLNSRDDYKMMMAHADMVRQGDRDGRGNLSERALTEFTEWFLEVCLDQVTYMTGLFELDTLVLRLRTFVSQTGLPAEAIYLLEHTLRVGETPRGEAGAIMRMKERSARTLLNQIIETGILRSDIPKGPVSLRFPIRAVEILFPALFPAL